MLMVLPFEQEYREKYYALLDEVFDSNFWSEGHMQQRFENEFEAYTGLKSRCVTNGGTGLLAIFEYLQIADKEVIVPANTFWATAMAVKKAGGKVIYADCNRNDLCLSYEDMIKRVTPQTKAVVVVHIGGHIAFEIEKIAAYCKEHSIYLVEDCAHAHGARWNGRSAGSWGIAGSYSFYATKTMPLGEGGMVVSANDDFIDWVSKYRNYGKQIKDGAVSYPVKDGFNYRMNEMTAALGIVQLERLPLILDWKRALAAKYDKIFENRVHFPSGMESGYYKYIVFDYKIKEQTGKVFNRSDFGYSIENLDMSLPSSEWVAEHHTCLPIYYGWEHASLPIEALKDYLI